MGRKTFSAPIKIVGSAGTSSVLETATSGDSLTAGTVVMEASGDLKSQNVGGQKVLVGPFMAQNLATNQAQVAQNIANVVSSSGWAAPYAGSILGITGAADANITAGTMTAFVTVNGTTKFQASNGATGVKLVRATQDKDVKTFVAGDLIGVKVTTTVSYAPTTLDWNYFVVVEI